ncbi:MAG: hypothetical protein ACRCXQ_05715 [Vagococcus fluvialis]
MYEQEFIPKIFGIQPGLFDSDFMSYNFGPYSDKLAKSIIELLTHERITMIYEKKNDGSKNNSLRINNQNSFYYDDKLDQNSTLNYKVFKISDNDSNLAILENIKNQFDADKTDINFEIFKKELETFAAKMCNTNINNILKYVYEKYPQFTNQSLIKDEILSTKENE